MIDDNTNVIAKPLWYSLRPLWSLLQNILSITTALENLLALTYYIVKNSSLMVIHNVKFDTPKRLFTALSIDSYTWTWPAMDSMNYSVSFTRLNSHYSLRVVSYESRNSCSFSCSGHVIARIPLLTLIPPQLGISSLCCNDLSSFPVEKLKRISHWSSNMFWCIGA